MAKKGLFHNKKYKRVQAFIYGVGAAIVIIGALFKIMHWNFNAVLNANNLLILGLGTEALIFLISAIEPPHEDVEWELVYPELAADGEGADYGSNNNNAVKGGSITQQLDTMLEEANVETELIKRLGDNLGKLGDNIEKMNDVADAAGATSEYTDNAKQAAGALAEMKEAYAGATAAVSELTAASSGTKDYHEQVQQISKNLGALNSMYELELQDTNNHLKAMNKFYSHLVDAMDKMEEAKDDADKYKTEMATLTKNLSSLNSVYGNMLTAMRPNA